MGKVSEDNVLGQHLMMMANAVQLYDTNKEINEDTLSAVFEGQLYTPISTSQKAQDYQALLNGAEDAGTAIAQVEALPDAIQASREQMLQLVGATAHAFHTNNETAGIIGIRLLAKTGRDAGRILQSMSLLYKQLPEFMLKNTLNDIEAYNELNPIAKEIVGDANPDTLLKAHDEATAEAGDVVEAELQQELGAVEAQHILEAQSLVVSVANQLGEQASLSKDELAGLQYTLKQAEQGKTKAEAEAKEAKAKLVGVEKELAKATKALNETAKAKAGKMKDKRIATLEAEIKKLIKERDSLTKQLTNANDKVTQLEAGKASMQATIAELTGKVADGKAIKQAFDVDKQALANQLAEAEAKIRKLEDVVDNTKANVKAEVLKAIEALKARHDLPEATPQEAQTVETVQQLKDKILKMSKKLEEATKGNFANQKRLEALVKKLESQLHAKQNAIEALINSGSNEEVAQVNQEYSEALQRIAELEEEIANYDPRQMLRNELASNTAQDLASSFKRLVANGKKDVAMRRFQDLPDAKRNEVAKLLLC
jgi:predicted  nucleic acid-binding Zn-ribbon protein